MNSATPSEGELSASGFFYFIGITFGVLDIIVSIATAYRYCAHIRNSKQPPQQILSDQSVRIGVGLDKDILCNYPKLLYAEVTTQNKRTASCCCSICLADYDNTTHCACYQIVAIYSTSSVLVLGCCSILASCPICRSSLMTAPQLIHLSDMVSLANMMV
ncbi:hypothetical protein MKX01_004776 [Papaver californicum]|nr:hypothetical protein MKX01_004776 [Papaver californicum]